MNGIKVENHLSFGKISFFIKSCSTDNLPGPVINKLIEHINKSKSISYPPTNPFDDLINIVVNPINITKNIADILVRIPTSKQMPPVNSTILTGSASCGGIPISDRKPIGPPMSCNFKILCAMKTIPTINLNGKGPNFEKSGTKYCIVAHI